MMNQLQIQKCIEKLTSICLELEALPAEIKNYQRESDKYDSLNSLFARILNIYELVFEKDKTEFQKAIFNLEPRQYTYESLYRIRRLNLITETKKLIDTIEILFIDRD